MPGVYQLEIKENLDELKKLLRVQKTASDKERIQLLYLLKSEQAQTITMVARLLGRHRVTVQKWLSRYRTGGIENLLARKPRTGRKQSIPIWAQEALEKQLRQEQGFESYQQICQWLSDQLGIESNYKTVHRLVHYRLQASPKVPRPLSSKKSDEKVESFKKKRSENLALLSWYAIAVLGMTGKVRLFCQDETRIGLKTISGRKITARGIKPKGKVQWQFKATYLYGIVEPKTGEHFFYEFSHLNSDCFQVFLNLISQHFADSILILQLDQAGCHRAKKLQIPSNIIFLFQPSHSPETNPIETVWQHLKRGLRWKLPKTLDDLRQLISDRLAEMNQQVIYSIVGRKSILQALSVAGI